MRKVIEKVLFALSAWSVFAFSACEKIVLVDGGDTISAENSVRLTLITRSDGSPGAASLVQGRIYIFHQSECVQMFDIDEDDNTVTMRLGSGTYKIYAVGGDDLDRFTLPSQTNAAPGSIIKLQEGKVMDNFFSKQVSVTLTDGESQTENITLERKVICLNKIEVKDVPSNVTNVEVKLSSFYDAILLDGTFPESPLTDYQTSLTKQSDGTTWQATPQALLFPSAGNLALSISFVTAKGTNVYSYTTSEALEANHHYSISSTYKSQAQLNVTLTATGWDEDHDIDFDFNDDDMVSLPVAGQFYNGYYVVSAEDESRTAVLLSKMVSYDAPDTKDASAWRAELNKQMEALDKPANVTGNWRLPTADEVEIFTKDPQAVTYDEDGLSPICFCEKEGRLTWAYSKKVGDDYTFYVASDPSFVNTLRLRPVIDISY